MLNLSLEQTLSSILQSLAKFFGVTIETIMANAPMWLSKYGWYITIKDISSNIGLSFIIGVLIVFAIFLLCDGRTGGSTTPKWLKIVYILIIIIFPIISVLFDILLCLIAPEFVGIESLINLVTNA